MLNPKLAESDQANIAQKATQARASVQAPLAPNIRRSLRQQAAEFLSREDAVLVAHYYVDSELQELAEDTGGCVADSLEMARFGFTHSASTVVVAGVRFMGETAKILSPEKEYCLSSHRQSAPWILAVPRMHSAHSAISIQIGRWSSTQIPAHRSKHVQTGW